MCSHWSSLNFGGNRICEISQVFLSKSISFALEISCLSRSLHISPRLPPSC
jgi:hypothetical protein